MSFWTDRPVLVTGATGLVGGWLVKELLHRAADVTCLVRDWVPQSELVSGGNLSSVKVARGDICDQALLERVLGENEIHTVFHLAAQTLVPVANRNPVSTFQSNIAGTWSLLEACRRSPKIQQIVVASSDKAYGDHDVLPYDERAPLQGRHPYDVSKSCADLIAQSYASTFQMPIAITRCGNFFGGGDLNWNRLVPGTIRSVLRGERPVLRSDGRSMRDYIYVEDGALAYLLLAEKLAEKPELAGEAFNFSYEEPLCPLEVVHAILSELGSSLETVVLGEATHEIFAQWLSSAKAQRVLGWKPRFTFADGLRRTLEWYADRERSWAFKTTRPHQLALVAGALQ